MTSDILRKKIFSIKLADKNDNTNINKNYENNKTIFKYSNDNIYSIYIKSIIVNMVGESDPDMDCYTHCENLKNGINMFYIINGKKHKINKQPIKTISDFFSIAHAKDINFTGWGNGNGVVNIFIDFNKIFGSLLKLSYGDEIIFEANDNLDTCILHEVIINGFYLE